VRQFIHGLSLPFHLARALRTDAVAWRRYLRVATLQSLVILAIGFSCTRSAGEVVDTAREGIPQQPGNAAHAEASTAQPRQALEGFKVEVKHSADELAQEARQLTIRLGDANEPQERSPSEVKTKVVIGELQFWAALFAVLQIAQWVVIALSRDYHDAISRDASLLTALEPEDPPLTPRIRLDLKWMAKKLHRRVRGFLVVSAGVPVIFMFTAPWWRFSDELFTVLVALWSAYWVVVFTTSKSALAWEDTSGRAPWFLRGWSWLTTKVPGFRWGFLQAYGRFWENRTRAVYSPATELEKQPWTFSGLAVIRALAMLPVFKCFLRPLIAVACAHLIQAQRPAAPTVSLEPAAPPSSPAALTSASAA
jgi:hypothetical protein